MWLIIVKYKETTNDIEMAKVNNFFKKNNATKVTKNCWTIDQHTDAMVKIYNIQQQSKSYVDNFFITRTLDSLNDLANL